MNFNLTEEQIADRSYYQSFAENILVPYVPEMECEGSTPDAVLSEMEKAELLGIPISQKYGGKGKDYISATLCMEELSKISPATAGIINVSTEIVGCALEEYGTEEQKERYLVPIARGSKIGAFALTESGAGSDASGVKTTAVFKDGHWVLNGSKCFITNAEIASIFLIAAQTTLEDGKKKISMFIVEKDFPGFSIGSHEDKMGIRSSSTCELILDDCIVPEENLLGVKGKGLKIALGGLDGGRVMIAAQGLGLAKGCMEETIQYLKTHGEETNNAVNCQRAQFNLALMQTKIEAAEMLVYRAAAYWSEGRKFSKEAAMAKYYATDIANEVTRECIQQMGLEGCVYGTRAEQFFRDAKITEIYEGTNEIQLMVIAGQMQLKA